MAVKDYSSEKQVLNKHIFEIVEGVLETAVSQGLSVSLMQLQQQLFQEHLGKAGQEVMWEYDTLIAEEERAIAYAAFVAGIRYGREFDRLIASFDFPTETTATDDITDMVDVSPLSRTR